MRTLGLLLVLLVGIPCAFAQQAQVRVSASPYYVGVPIDVHVIVDGFEESPEPTIEADAPSGTVLSLVGVSPNVSTSIQIINGQMTRDHSVRFVYRYRLLAQQPGRLEVGPFNITQGTTTASARAVQFEIGEVPTASEQRFRLVLPEGPHWVGQRLPVTLEWWLTESFAERLAGRRARVPLFDLVDRFKFEDDEVPEATSTLAVDTVSGALDLPVAVRRDEWRGEPYLVVSANRTMIALKAGEVAIEPASIVTEEATRWSTDFFGNRTPATVRRLRVEDEPRTLVFKSPPAEGRPASFAGAIGEGFTLEVSADRSVVQTGDPIRLTLDVRGDAALDTVSLPRLAASGLDPNDFKIPDGPVAGIVDGGVKRFDVVLRVKNEQVREIPPIELSWFNPDLAQYESTRSRPIAVSVRAANVVSAADVVTTSDGEGEVDKTPYAEEPLEGEPSAIGLRGEPVFTLSGAELAIETRDDVLRWSAVPWYARAPALSVMYAGGLLALVLGFADRRRASVHPDVRSLRQTLEAERRAIEREARVGGVARALRRMAAASPALPRADYDSILLDCDNLAYAPGGGDDAPIDSKLRARALGVADAIIEGAR